MADSKYSALTGVASISGTEEFSVNESGTSKKATATQVSEYVETRYQQGVSCTYATDQTLTTATWTALKFDTEAFKVGDSSIHSNVTNNTRLTAQIAGEYLIVATIMWEAIAAAFIIQAQILKNGGTALQNHAGNNINHASQTSFLTVSVLAQLAATNYVELRGRHTRGSDLDVISAHTRFGMYLVGR